MACSPPLVILATPRHWCHPESPTLTTVPRPAPEVRKNTQSGTHNRTQETCQAGNPTHAVCPASYTSWRAFRVQSLDKSVRASLMTSSCCEATKREGRGRICPLAQKQVWRKLETWAWTHPSSWRHTKTEWFPWTNQRELGPTPKLRPMHWAGFQDLQRTMKDLNSNTYHIKEHLPRPNLNLQDIQNKPKFKIQLTKLAQASVTTRMLWPFPEGLGLLILQDKGQQWTSICSPGILGEHLSPQDLSLKQWEFPNSQFQAYQIICASFSRLFWSSLIMSFKGARTFCPSSVSISIQWFVHCSPGWETTATQPPEMQAEGHQAG